MTTNKENIRIEPNLSHEYIQCTYVKNDSYVVEIVVHRKLYISITVFFEME